jgi:hypothetical protein
MTVKAAAGLERRARSGHIETLTGPDVPKFYHEILIKKIKKNENTLDKKIFNR